VRQSLSSSPLGLKKERICLFLQPTGLNRLIQQTAGLPFCVPPITLIPEGTLITRWYRNINLFSITYAFRPRLRDRLTLSRLTLLRKPEVFGERVFHPLYRYSCQHGHFCSVQPSLRSTFNPNRTLPYRPFPPKRKRTRSFGNVLKPRYIFGADSLDQ
jgi:hypothetical protein